MPFGWAASCAGCALPVAGGGQADDRTPGARGAAAGKGESYSSHFNSLWMDACAPCRACFCIGDGLPVAAGLPVPFCRMRTDCNGCAHATLLWVGQTHCQRLGKAGSSAAPVTCAPPPGLPADRPARPLGVGRGGFTLQPHHPRWQHATRECYACAASSDASATPVLRERFPSRHWPVEPPSFQPPPHISPGAPPRAHPLPGTPIAGRHLLAFTWLHLSCPPSPPLPGTQILEYHHKRSKSSLLHPQLPALHRVSPSMPASLSLAAGGSSMDPGGGSRPGTPGSSSGGGGGSKQGSFGRRVGMFELMVKSQSAAWAEGGPLAAQGDSGTGGGTGGLASRAPSFAEGRSGLGSRQSSLSQRGSGGGQGVFARRCAEMLPLVAAQENDARHEPHVLQHASTGHPKNCAPRIRRCTVLPQRADVASPALCVLAVRLQAAPHAARDGAQPAHRGGV